jgi:hypothetical protein
MSIDDREYAKDKVTVMGSRRSAPNRAKRILGLGAVFHPQARPAIKLGAAPAEPVAGQARNAGALSLGEATRSPYFERLAVFDKATLARQDSVCLVTLQDVPKWRNWQTR